MRLLPLSLLIAACGAPVAADMEHALFVTNDAIALTLLAAEPAAWVDAEDSPGAPTTEPPGARHPSGLCPRLSRDPDTGDVYTITASYLIPGCVSTSGLVPAVLLGDLVLAIDGDGVTADVSALQIGLERGLSGTWSATRTDTESVAVTADIALPEVAGRAAIDATLDLTVGFDESGLLLGGTTTITRDGITDDVTLDQVRLELSNIPGECSVPSGGSVEIAWDPPLSVDLATPGDGKVTVLRGKRASEPTRLCSFASDAY